MAGPQITVALPVYNGERYLDRAIRSVLDQSWRDLELVVVDNASSDATEEIARRAADRDDRVRYVRQPENVGAVGNFNTGLALARGTFFCWLAHDDWLAPEYLERCLAELGDHDLVVCSTMMGVTDESGEIFRIQRERLVGADAAHPRQRLHSMLWTLQDPTAPVFGLIRVATLRRVGGMPSVPEPDRHLLYALSLHGKLRALPDVLFHHYGPPGHSAHYGVGRMHRRSWDWLHPPGRRRIKLSPARVISHQLTTVLRSDLPLPDRGVAALDVCGAFLVRRGSSKGRKIVRAYRRRLTGG